MANYSANGTEITSDISENITQDSYIPTGTTVSILNDVTIEPNVKLTIRGTGKLIIPEGRTLTISRGSTLILKHLPYETPDLIEYPISSWSSEITDPDGDGTYTDSVFTYTKSGNNFIRRAYLRLTLPGPNSMDISFDEDDAYVMQYSEDKLVKVWISNQFERNLRIIYEKIFQKDTSGKWNEILKNNGYLVSDHLSKIEGNTSTGMFFEVGRFH